MSQVLPLLTLMLVRMWYQSPPPWVNFDQAGTDTIMTHVPSFNAKVKRNEQLLATLEIGNMYWPTFNFKNSPKFQCKELNYQKKL